MRQREALIMTSRVLAVASLVIALVSVVPAVAQELPRPGERWQIAGAFPQSEPGPLERQAKPITPENPIPRRTRLVRPPYPPEAAVVGARTTVTLRVTVDHLGTVGEVRPVGVPVLGAMSPPSPSDEWAFTAGLLALIRSAKDSVAQWLYDPPADGPVAFDVVIGFTSMGDGDVIAQSVGRTSAAAIPQPSDRESRNVTQPRKVRHVNPVYPAAAREKKIAGVVILEARIEPDGRVVEARVLRSIPELDEAAIDAVKQWEFTPTLINGVATPVTMTMTIQFSLP
jgi:TonB family protein